MRADAHPRQEERLAALRSFGILDTPRERNFDEVVELIATICEAPIAVVNLIDENRQWFEAEVGLGVRETPLETSICSHVILLPGLTIVPDTLKDPRFSDNPLCIDEPNLRFYAGMCLQTDKGLPIGTLCVLDTEPRNLSELQQHALQVMGRQVMRQIELTKALHLSDLMRKEVDHRVKNSLSIIGATLSMQARQIRDSAAADALAKARNRITAIGQVHDQLQQAAEYGRIEVGAFFGGLKAALSAAAPLDTEIVVTMPDVSVATEDAVHLGIITNELITNSIQHGSTGKPVQVRLTGRADTGRLLIDVSDNGPGLPEDFNLENRSGLGLKVCRKLTEALGGQLTWTRAQDGTCFQFSTPIKAP